MKLTREQAIAEHRKMWNWIADETLKRKEKVTKCDYLEIFFPNQNINSLCFLCDYSANRKKSENVSYNKHYKICERFCPLKWGNDPKDTCVETYNTLDSGLFEKWCYSRGYKKAADLARQIAELPEKEVVEDVND